jgi:hypothetical protein
LRRAATAERVATAVFQEIERFPDFDEDFVAAVTAEAKRLDGDRAEQLAKSSADQRCCVTCRSVFQIAWEKA